MTGFISAMSFLGGAGIAVKLVDEKAAIEFLWVGLIWTSLGTAGMIWLGLLSRQRAIAYLFFTGLFCIAGIMSVFVGITLPLFWLYSPTSQVGASLIGNFLIALVYQLWRGSLHFNECWRANKDRAMADLYAPDRSTLDIEPMIRSLHIQADLFLPFRSEAVKASVSVGLFLSMIVGLNLRKIYPEFSSFAWGIPALTMSAVCVQMAFIRLLLASKVRDIERSLARNLLPGSVSPTVKKSTRRRGRAG